MLQAVQSIINGMKQRCQSAKELLGGAVPCQSGVKASLAEDTQPLLEGGPRGANPIPDI